MLRIFTKRRASIALTAIAAGMAACGTATKNPGLPSASIAPKTDDAQGEAANASTSRKSLASGTDEEPGRDEGEGGDGMSVEGLRGHLDSYDIQKGVQRRASALAQCFHARAQDQPFLGGKIELAFRVRRDGGVKTVRTATSGVGSWAVEKCLLQESLAMQFKKPEGGEADFSLPLEFEAAQTANWWSESKSEKVVDTRALELSRCSSSSVADPLNVWVTLYVGNRGAVESVGFASPHKDGIDPAWADCAEALVSAWSLEDPRGKLVKLGFRYNPE